MKRAAAILVGVIGAAGMAARFAPASPLWLDEALSVNLASLDLADLPDALRRDGHPILYYALLGFWIDLVGDGDRAVRGLSGLFSAAAVPVMWAAARRRTGPKAAAYTAVLAATSPFLIRYGSEARMYALAVLIAALGWWATEAALEKPSGWRLAGVAAAAAAGLHTHYWMIWPAFGTAAVLAVGWIRRPDRRRALGSILAALAVGGLGFAGWLGVFADQLRHTGTPWAKWARPAEVAVEAMEGIGGGTRFEPVLLGVVLTLAIAAGATIRRTGPDWVEIASPGRNPAAPMAGVAAIALGAGGLAAAVTGGAFEARYTAVVVPLLLGLAGRGLAGLPGRAAPLALLAVAAFGVVVAVEDGRRDRTQGRQVADAIDEQSAPGDRVVICPDQLAPATLRYLDAPLEVQTYPPTPDPRFVDWYDYRDRIAAADPGAYARTVADPEAAPGAVWMVMMTSYRGFEDRCEAVAAAIGRGRTRRTLIWPGRQYEPMFLHHFEANP